MGKEEGRRGRAVRLTVVRLNDPERGDDPVIRFISQSLRQAEAANDREAWFSWLDTLSEVHDTRALAALAAPWN